MVEKAANVLVVGASNGLGKAVAEKFAREGHAVVGTARSVPIAYEAPMAGSVSMYPLDISSDRSVEEFAGLLSEIGFSPDIAVISAGFGISGPVETTMNNDALRQFQTNYFGVDRIVKILLPMMRAAGEGRIAIIGSIASRLPLAYQAHYTASKAAIAAYCFALAQEVMRFGIKVTLIEPGDHKTGFTESRQPSAAGHSWYEPDYGRAMKIMERNEVAGGSPGRLADKIYPVLVSDRHRAIISVTRLDERVMIFVERLLKKDHILRILMSYFKIRRHPSR